jgi:SPP1 gp7 family putative phage head morphogenesis protein
MKYLRPMLLRERYYAPVETEIQRLFNKIIYAPLSAVFYRYSGKPPEYSGPDAKGAFKDELKNAGNATNAALVSAIHRGDIWYADGAFHGLFNAQITVELRKLGATYSRTTQTWALESGNVPATLKFAQAAADDRAETLRKQLLTTLDEMRADYVGSENDLEDIYNGVLDEMEDGFAKTIPAIEAISITAKLVPEQRERIAKEWSRNLELYIQDWTKQNILQLRSQLQAPVLGGARAESFETLLQDNYGVSRRKAQFLARQETSLLMSKYHETSCANLGITQYRWGGANDARERPDHRALNGKVFSFSDPPVTDQRTGARNNPGEDYNCRCVAIPILQ